MKKIGFIVLAVILALGLVGAAYAAWNQNVFVNASVQTGNVAVQITSSDVGAGAILVGGANSTETTMTVTEGFTSAYQDTLNVTIANAYPGLAVAIPFYVTNTGTVGCSLSFASAVTGGYNGGANLSDSAGSFTSAVLAPTAYTAGTVTVTADSNIVSGETETISIPITAVQTP